MKKIKKILGAVFGLFAAISLTVPSYAAVCVSGSVDSLQQDPHYKEVSEIAEGINEANYQGIREIYRRYQEVRNGASDLGEMEKIRYIHEYLVNTLEPVPAGETQMQDAHWIQNVFSGQYAYCIAYTNLFYLFGRGCGLEVGYDGGKDGGHGVRNHVRNTVTVNGELRYLDVMWDDNPVDPDRYYLTKECSLKEYH